MAYQGPGALLQLHIRTNTTQIMAYQGPGALLQLHIRTNTN